jgi:hypothetical protein
MTDRPSFLLRRLRALLRPLTPGGGRIEGFVDGCVAGEIRGWALDRHQPGRRVHVLAIIDGRVVAEALADISRADLVQDGRGDGRHAFRLRLPAALLDGETRRVQVRAVAGGAPVRLLRGEIEIGSPDGAEILARNARGGAAPAGAPEDERPAPAVVLALWPGEGEAAAGWSSEVVRLGAGELDAARLAAAHTVIFARSGDRLDPAAADLLSHGRPLADVVTWDGAGATSRRPESRAVGVLLGETLDGAFALRGQVFTLAGAPLLEALAAGDRRRVELVLAGRRELRWAHLPGPLTVGPAAPPAAFPRAPAPITPERIALAVWPAWSPDAAGSLRALIARARPDTQLEALVEASGAEEARALIRTLGREVAVRAVDALAAATAGAWLAALTAAASAEAVVVCQAGVRLCDAPGALEEIAAWASAPGVGAATIEVRGPGEPLAGLALARSDGGWSAASAFAPELKGASRPVLAAPAAFLAIGRDRLAMLGGPADERLSAGGADLDLGLRLRRIGLASVLLGDLFAEAAAGVRLSGALSGAAMAAFDPAELAAAAAAFPAPGSR